MKPITHRRAMELLANAQVFCPAVVPNLGATSGFTVFSAMKVLGQGETLDAALADARRRGNMPDLPPFSPFRDEGKDVTRFGEVVATAKSRTYANRIANALNQYFPNERGL